MGEQPQLDLAVVRVHEDVPRPGDEHPPHARAELTPDRDVLQIRLPGGQPARVRHGHLERRVDAAVRGDGLQKAVRVGALELRKLPVFEHHARDRVFVTELFEYVDVCAPAGLRLLSGGQGELFKQHLAELLGGEDVEFAAGQLPDRRLQRRDAVGQAAAEIVQRLPVDEKARVLHLREYGAQRQLDVVVQRVHPQRLELRSEYLLETRHRSRPLQILREPLHAVVQQGELPVPVRGRQREAAVFLAQAVEVVVRRRRVQQIRRQRRVEHPAAILHTERKQSALDVLDVVSRLGDGGGK